MLLGNIGRQCSLSLERTLPGVDRYSRRECHDICIEMTKELLTIQTQHPFEYLNLRTFKVPWLPSSLPLPHYPISQLISPPGGQLLLTVVPPYSVRPFYCPRRVRMTQSIAGEVCSARTIIDFCKAACLLRRLEGFFFRSCLPRFHRVGFLGALSKFFRGGFSSARPVWTGRYGNGYVVWISVFSEASTSSACSSSVFECSRHAVRWTTLFRDVLGRIDYTLLLKSRCIGVHVGRNIWLLCRIIVVDQGKADAIFTGI